MEKDFSRSLAGNPVCHSERSEESLYSLDSETLRCAQGDRNRLSGHASKCRVFFTTSSFFDEKSTNNRTAAGTTLANKAPSFSSVIC